MMLLELPFSIGSTYGHDFTFSTGSSLWDRVTRLHFCYFPTTKPAINPLKIDLSAISSHFTGEGGGEKRGRGEEGRREDKGGAGEERRGGERRGG